MPYHEASATDLSVSDPEHQPRADKNLKATHYCPQGALRDGQNATCPPNSPHIHSTARAITTGAHSSVISASSRQTQEKQTSLAPPPTNPHRRPQERHDYALQRAPASPSPTRGRHRALAGALIRPRRRALHAALATEVRGAGQGRETSCDRVLRRRALGGLGSRARVSGSGVDGDAGFVLLEVGYVLFETGPWTGPESSPGWSRSVGCDR